MSNNRSIKRGPFGRAPKGERPADFSADYRGTFAEKSEDTDVEIDDFLLGGENSLTDDGLLTKWGDDDAGGGEPAEPKPPKRRGRRRYGVVLGAFVLLLALTGVVFIATTVGTQIYKSATDDTKLRAYDVFLTPVVMQDPMPFEAPDKADAEFVQNAALWKTITANNGTNYTQYDDAGRVLIPLGEMTEACRQIFGPDRQLSPKNPEVETFFTYDEITNEYHVSLYSADSSFSPYVESARDTADGRVLRVGYVSPSDPWRTQTTSTTSEGGVQAPVPTKYMEYVLKTDPATKTEYLFAVREIAK